MRELETINLQGWWNEFQKTSTTQTHQEWGDRETGEGTGPIVRDNLASHLQQIGYKAQFTIALFESVLVRRSELNWEYCVNSSSVAEFQ